MEATGAVRAAPVVERSIVRQFMFAVGHICEQLARDTCLSDKPVTQVLNFCIATAFTLRCRVMAAGFILELATVVAFSSKHWNGRSLCTARCVSRGEQV